MTRATSRPGSGATRSAAQRERALAEIEVLAWLLDNSIPVPGTGRRFGLDALIGFVPVFGDVFGGLMSLVVVWRGSRMGLPRIVVLRMLVNAALDFAISVIPIVGDAFDLWFKVNERNLGIIRRHLADPDASTRDDWLVVLGLVGVIVVLLVVIVWVVGEVLSLLAQLVT